MNRLSPCLWLGLVFAAISGMAGQASAQPLRAEIVGVGFPANVATNYVARQGSWLPILVKLDLPGTEFFEGELRCEVPDLDGDRVVYRAPFVLTGGQSRRVFCYVSCATAELVGGLTLDVVRSDGAAVLSLPVPAFDFVRSDRMLVLDLSDTAVTSLRLIESRNQSPDEDTFLDRRYYRTPIVTRGEARNLPDQWWGLEAIDVVVWDKPEPGALSPAQSAALVEWVKRGGQLLVGVGETWPVLQRSDLAPLLPLQGDSTTENTAHLPRFFRELTEAGQDRFGAPVAVATVRATDDARSYRDQLPSGQVVDLFADRLVGSGRVTTSAVALNDLASVKLKPEEFWRELIDLNRFTDAFVRNATEQVNSAIGFNVSTALYPPLIDPIDFKAYGTVFLLAALAFVAAYILIATLGSWTWLRRRSLAHLSWTAFAIAAVVFSVISLGAVRVSRGFSRLHSMAMLDLESGARAAQGPVYFGYRSAGRQLLDLSMPGGDDFLRPLTAATNKTVEYATPLRYEAQPGKAELDGAPIRATLKQFEGYWAGPLDGTIGTRLVASRRTGRITPESWIANDLNVKVVGGYLLYLDPRINDPSLLEGLPRHAAGYEQSYRNFIRPRQGEDAAKLQQVGGSSRVPPAFNVLIVELQPINAGEQSASLGQAEYRAYEQAVDRWLRSTKPILAQRPELPNLWSQQITWVGNLANPFGVQFDATWNAAALACTRDLYLPSRAGEFDKFGRTISTAGLMDCDVTHWLVPQQAVLLLFLDAPAPATITVGNPPRPLRVQQGRTILRVRAPLTYTNESPPSRADIPDPTWSLETD